jgi:transcriptional regulator with XRE-family HTH domain
MDIETLKRVSEVRLMLASGQARQRRMSLRMSLREVAKALDIDVSAVSRWEAGRTQPRPASALKLADILGVENSPSRDIAA